MKNWCFWTVVLEKALDSLLDCKEIQPVHLKRNLSWIFIGRTEAETPIFEPPYVKKWLIGKDPDAGKDWRREEKGMREDERLDGITDLVDMSLSKLWELVTDRETQHVAVHGITKSQTWLSDWTELIAKQCWFIFIPLLVICISSLEKISKNGPKTWIIRLFFNTEFYMLFI